MYIWSFKKLTNDLKNNQVSEKDKFKYFFTVSVFGLLAIESIMYSSLDFNLSNALSSLLRIVGFLVAILIIYNKNKAGDNKNFIERYICLSFPTIIQAIVYFFITLIIFSIIEAVVLGDKFKEISSSSGYVDDIFSLAFFVVLVNYWIYKAVEKISKN